MMEMVKNFIKGRSDVLQLEQFQINSHKFTHDVKSRNFHKVYKVVSEKRRVLDNFTLPYGFCKNYI